MSITKKTLRIIFLKIAIVLLLISFIYSCSNSDVKYYGNKSDILLLNNLNIQNILEPKIIDLATKTSTEYYFRFWIWRDHNEQDICEVIRYANANNRHFLIKKKLCCGRNIFPYNSSIISTDSIIVSNDEAKILNEIIKNLDLKKLQNETKSECWDAGVYYLEVSRKNKGETEFLLTKGQTDCITDQSLNKLIRLIDKQK